MTSSLVLHTHKIKFTHAFYTMLEILYNIVPITLYSWGEDGQSADGRADSQRRLQ